jgi:hypothetical protein
LQAPISGAGAGAGLTFSIQKVDENYQSYNTNSHFNEDIAGALWGRVDHEVRFSH